MPDERIPTPDPERIDLEAVAGALRAGKASMAWLGKFLPATYEAPARFRKALYAFASRRVTGLKSRLDDGYDLYYDIIGIHVGKRRRAFIAATAAGDSDITFDNLHARSGALSLAWAQAGVKPGSVVAIVLPIGIDSLVAMAACLRLGAIFAMVSPDGPSFVRNRLERLAPDHIVTNDKLAKLCGEVLADKRLPFAFPTLTNATPPSYWYKNDEPVMRVLSSFGIEGADPIDLSAANLHEALLVAGLVVFALELSDVVAAPGFSAAQFQPQLLLATLSVGAAYAEIAVDDIVADPKIVTRAGVTVFGVCRAVRDALVEKGSGAFPKGPRAWFRSLTETLDIERWIEFQNLAWDRKVAGFCIVASTAAPFVHLFSPPAPPGVGAQRVWPIPGRSFELTEVAAGELSALRDSGIYTPLVDEKPAEPSGLPSMMFARQDDGYIFAGCVDTGRDAQTYPAEEVARVVESHRFVKHAVVVLAPGKHANDAVVVLLAFTEDHRDREGKLVQKVLPDDLKALVVREMGPALAPNRIEVFPLRPRIVEGKVDVVHCRDQYFGGLLHKKASSEIFLLMSRLGYVLAGPRTSP